MLRKAEMLRHVLCTRVKLKTHRPDPACEIIIFSLWDILIYYKFHCNSYRAGQDLCTNPFSCRFRGRPAQVIWLRMRHQHHNTDGELYKRQRFNPIFSIPHSQQGCHQLSVPASFELASEVPSPNQLTKSNSNHENYRKRSVPSLPLVYRS